MNADFSLTKTAPYALLFSHILLSHPPSLIQTAHHGSSSYRFLPITLFLLHRLFPMPPFSQKDCFQCPPHTVLLHKPLSYLLVLMSTSPKLQQKCQSFAIITINCIRNVVLCKSQLLPKLFCANCGKIAKCRNMPPWVWKPTRGFPGSLVGQCGPV